MHRSHSLPRPAQASVLAMLTATLLCATVSAQIPPQPHPNPAGQPAQTLPPAQPTQLTQPTPPAAPAPPAARPAYRARIEFSGGQLAVTAENSSLNDILRDISHITGMKITGGVTDERVYGTYGPGSAQDVLGQLLDGTGSNILLLEGPQHGVAELVLTPRHGGATPPNPNAAREAERDDADLPPQLGGRRRGRPFENDRPPSPAGAAQQPQQPTPPPAADPGTQPAQPVQPPDPGTTTQQSPNGVKTPQQIYDELEKQQKQQTTPPPS